MNWTCTLQNALPLLSVLFAQRPPGRGGASAGMDAGTLVVWIVAAAVVVAVLCGALVAANRLHHQRRFNSKWSLYHQLCRLHGLDRGNRRLLGQLVRQHNLAYPATIFTDPKWFNPAIQPPALRAHGPQLTALAERLFADPSGGKKA